MTDATPQFKPGDRLKWSGKPATVTRLHDTAPQMFIRMDQGFFGQEVLIGFENEGIERSDPPRPRPLGGGAPYQFRE